MSRDTVPDVVCATCQKPLNRWHHDGKIEWVHPKWETDHEPVPIPRSEATQVVHVCDFCGGDDVRWVYPTGEEIHSTVAKATYTDERERKRFAKHWDSESNVPGLAKDLVQNNYSQNWTACETCSGFIEIPDIERLITHLRRYNPEVFAKSTRTLLRQHFAEFFRTKQPREPIEAHQNKTVDMHDHALSNTSLPPDPDDLPVDLVLLDQLVGAAIDQCQPCQETLLDRVAADPTTTYGLIDLSLRAVQDKLGGVPHPLLDLDRPDEPEAPGWVPLGFRRLAAAADGGRNRRAAAELAGQLSEQERRSAADEALTFIAAMMSEPE